MLLRTHITLLLAASLSIATLGWAGAAWLQEQLMQQRLVLLGHKALTAQWSQALAAENRWLDSYMDRLVEQPHIQQAAAQPQLDKLLQSLASEMQQQTSAAALQEVAVLKQGFAPQAVRGQTANVLLDQVSQERALQGQVIEGLRVLGSGRAVILAARRLGLQTESGVLLVTARGTEEMLQTMTSHTGAAFTLLDVRGRVLASSDAQLWQLAEQALDQHFATSTTLHLADKVYALSSVPVHDVTGHQAGVLMQLTDLTQEAQAAAYLKWVVFTLSILFLLLVMLGMNLYVRYKLQPLERAIDALQALAHGQTHVRLPPAGDDEIGRIGQALVRFRHNVQALAATRSLRERIRRRQERLLRSKLEQLAQATQQPLTFATVSTDEEQLRQLAAVMNELSGRLIDQHHQLRTMVQELQEALRSKNRLIALEQELQIAAQLQLSILPCQPPQDARLQLDCHITPAREVGGDFYDYFLLDANHLVLVVADVSGKGVPAALFMTITRTLLKATAQFIAQPAECVQRLNDLLCQENEQMMFVTLFFGVMNLQTGQLRYVNAGHNAPYCLRTTGQVEAVPRTAGMAVAVREGLRYQERLLQLAPGEQLFLFTDGVTEAFNADGQVYGEERLLQVLQQSIHRPGCTAQDLNAAVVQDVHRFEQGAAPADDMTCMALRWLGAAPCN